MKLFKTLEEIVHKKGKDVVINCDEKITYEKFWQLLLNLANFLKSRNISKVSIIESEKPEYFCYLAMFASLLSGATYIPINNITPSKRLNSIIDLSESEILISEKKVKLKKKKILNFNKKDLFNLQNISRFNLTKSSRDAYIIFTSGSTGEPKGVRISRKSLDNYVEYLCKNVFVEKIVRCSQHPSIGFDLSVVDIYGTICSGGTIFPIRKKFDKIFLGNFIKKNQLTHWVSVPSASDFITDTNFNKVNHLLSLKKIFFCGEVLKKIHIEKIFKFNNKVEIINAYGPTEATVSCTQLKLNSKNYKKYCNPTVSIGKSIKKVKILIQIKNKKNNYGELVIQGEQLSKGYLNDKLLNDKKFVLYKKKRSFFTGDFCKVKNGFYYFLSRNDNQVKINGNRIELDEINLNLEKIVKDTVYSVVYKNQIFSFTLKKIDEKKIKNNLSDTLPNYMIPKKIYRINKWPKNKNLKIDEQNLKKNLFKYEKKNN